MTLDQLRIFIAVAEREHVTAAARALHVSQSAASAAIAALEERHDVRLFHRVGRGVELTDAGHIFLREARAVMARAAAAEQALEELRALTRGSLRLVASQTIVAYWLPAILARYRAQYPRIAIDLAIANTDQAAARVREGEADYGIVEGRIDDPALAVQTIGADRLQLVAATPFNAGAVDVDWLRRARWVMRERGSGTRSALEETLRGVGVDPADLDIALVLPSNESVRTAVEAGAGVAALSSLVVGPSLAAGALHAGPFDFGERLFHGLRHKERYRTRAADALVELITRKKAGASQPGA